jgi:hypothetical protein
MIREEAERILPVAVGAAFAYITAPGNWPRYWPGLTRVHGPAGARWRRPGDRVVVGMRLLGREVALQMTLLKFDEGRLMRYTSRQRGLPDALHERHFEAAPGGCRYRLAVTFAPRTGLAGLYDRLVVRRAVARALHHTLVNLAALLGGGDVPPALP